VKRAAEETQQVPESTCPSCGYGAALETPGVPEPPFPATPACYASYLDLSAYNAERARGDFLHQEAVDAFAAQHPGPPAKPITLWFALVGLHLAIDRGRSGRQVQLAHTRLARRRRVWQPLPPPADLTGMTGMTAADVLHHAPGDERDAALIRWAAQVWARWGFVHDTIASLVVELDL
jgi:hypothetical protein